MTRFSANLLNTLLINPFGGADIIILIHPDHPFSPGNTFHLTGLVIPEDVLGGGHFCIIKIDNQLGHNSLLMKSLVFY
jgi:hypothetical protein